jgi:hypothetical protein
MQFRYSGTIRVVEVHAAGYSKENKPIIRAWQVRGGSKSGNLTPWRTFNSDQIFDPQLLDEKSDAPRPGYVRGDQAIHRISCEL